MDWPTPTANLTDTERPQTRHHLRSNQQYDGMSRLKVAADPQARFN